MTLCSLARLGIRNIDITFKKLLFQFPIPRRNTILGCWKNVHMAICMEEILYTMEKHTKLAPQESMSRHQLPTALESTVLNADLHAHALM